jgi:hypothetical protein
MEKGNLAKSKSNQKGLVCFSQKARERASYKGTKVIFN